MIQTTLDVAHSLVSGLGEVTCAYLNTDLHVTADAHLAAPNVSASRPGQFELEERRKHYDCRVTNKREDIVDYILH